MDAMTVQNNKQRDHASGCVQECETLEMSHVEETGGNCDFCVCFLFIYSNPQRPLELVLSFFLI